MIFAYWTFACSLLVQTGVQDAGILGRPPSPDKQLPLPPITSGAAVPLPPAGGPDGDDVKVSSDSSVSQNETVIRVNPFDRQHLIGGANDDRDGLSSAFYSSLDAGQTWTEFFYDRSANTIAGDPGAAFGPNGEVYFSVLEVGSNSAVYVGQSFDGGASVPNWVRAVGGSSGNEDKPFMEVDRSDGPLSGSLYVTWTRFSADFNSYPIMVTSSDQGQAWSSPARVSDTDRAQGSCPTVGANSELYVAFYDFISSQILVDVSLDGGLTWGTDVVVGPVKTELPNAPFRHFNFPTCDVDLSGGPFHGTLYVAYHTYRRREGGTDVWLYRSTDGGQSFQGPVTVSDEPGDTSEFFPWLDVDDNGNVNIGYYDRRDDGGTDQVLKYRVSRSSDGGQSFQDSVLLSDVGFDPNNYRDGTFIGDYTGVAASDRTVHALWTDGREDNNDIFTDRAQLDLFTDVDSISAAAGGVVKFTLNPGPLYQGFDYLLLGSVTGTVPGLTFQNGVNLPLNDDMFFIRTLTQANSAVFQDFQGTLDATGSATPRLDTLGPIDPGLVGLHLDFAALVVGGGGPPWASNPTGLDIDP